MKRVQNSTKWCLAVLAGALSLLFASDAWAWGPATHLHYGISVLEQMERLGDAVRCLLSGQALSFLYGCVSADIVLAKKLGRAANHCHKWENGFRLIEEAKTDRVRAFTLGYVSHLAADTISHNCYVPSKSIESYDGKTVFNHMYWELLFDKRVSGERMLSLFRTIADTDFSDCDEHMEQLVPTRIFDFSTNKRIFNKLLMIQSLERFQKLWDSLSKKSPCPLRDREFKDFTWRSMEAVISFLQEGRNSPFCSVDPIGQDRLRAAHQLRRYFRRQAKRGDASKRFIFRTAQQFAADPFEPIEVEEVKFAA